ncbi:unnamed protein product [Rhizophagus irregularis]|uniref:Uncharacterized protein n=2 Tax=Rhizophagus irregularis TaxID=588596 RepID=U9T1V8_RHIID|nr:unnamed protein product [Rhizophagus irregularis]
MLILLVDEIFYETHTVLKLVLFFEVSPIMTDNTDCNNVISSSEKKGLLETLGKDIEIIKKRLCVITQEKESFKRRCTELEKKNRELSYRNVELQKRLDNFVKESE